MKVNILDENSGNPFPSELVIFNNLGNKERYVDGFCKEGRLIKPTVKEISEIIELHEKGKILDVGPGGNFLVAEALAEIGMEAYTIDKDKSFISYVPNIHQSKTPTCYGNENGVKRYVGNIKDIFDDHCLLRNVRFDLIICWGSWEAGEDEKLGESKNITVDYEARGKNYDYMQAHRYEILRTCKKTLNDGGSILMVSPRYSMIGLGFTFDELPWEKRINLRLASYFSNKKASEMTFFGLSKESILKQVKQYVNKDNETEIKSVINALTDDDKLFELPLKKYEAQPIESQINKIKKMDIPLGRIDALYARF